MSPALCALAVAAFATGMTELVMIGLVPHVSRDLTVRIPLAGLLVTGYVLAVTVGRRRSRPCGWEYPDGDEYATLPLPGALHVNSVQTYEAAGFAGIGLIQAALTGIGRHLESGRWWRFCRISAPSHSMCPWSWPIDEICPAASAPS